MPQLVPVLDEETIRRCVRGLGLRISADYQGKRLVVIGVLKGAFIFMADLVRVLKIPVELDFIQVASYGSATTSSGKVSLLKTIDTDIRGKDVLLVEDIVDTGTTLAYVMRYLQSLGAASVRICAVIDKRQRRELSVQLDYACHVAQDGFLVGYGLDYNQQYRELPGIYHLKF